MSNRVTRQGMRQAGIKAIAAATKQAAGATKAVKPRKPKKEKPLEQGFIPFQGETFKKPRKKPSQVEYRLHVNCEKHMKFFWPDEWEDCYHYPSEASSLKDRHFNKQKGVKPGFWDYLTLIERHGFAGLFIEFKIDSPLSDEQKAFRVRYRNRFAFAVVKTVERFMAVMSWYLGPSKVKKNFWIK